MHIQKLLNFVAVVTVAVFFSSCGKERSQITGWNYNDEKNGGFEVPPYGEQETGPGLVFIEGGTYSMGRTEQGLHNAMHQWDNVPRRITVSSFYIDEAEIANVHYREYLYWITRIFADAYPEVYKKALPDTLVWRSKLSYNEPYVELYLRHPAYQYYPVVGVNWLQASDFCAWRTDRVNEMIMVREGLLRMSIDQAPEDYFNTDAYLAGQYEGDVKGEMYDYGPNGESRKVRMEDGILLPRYRLPTEAEWEFAALAYIGNTVHERVTERRLYPWNGSILRTGDETYKGTMQANYVRGRGDYMGIAGKLNDAADITADIYSFWPNDYGLYCMAGNVSEWVMDVYRPLSPEDKNEFRPFRGNVFKTQVRDQDGFIADKHDDELILDADSEIVQLPGRLKWRDVTEVENVERRNYRESDNINFLDGDEDSEVKYDTYNKPKTVADLKTPDKKEPASMIDDRARVYKGGSWADRAYWLSPGTRRFLDERQSTAMIGFRCAMARVGGPSSFQQGRKK